MDFRNATPFEHALALGLGPDRRTHLAVVVKATFRIPERPGGPAPLADVQRPILVADEPHGGDPTASTREESDLVVHKPRADVIVVGCAHAPHRRPVAALDARLRVGRLDRTLRVIGDRRWQLSPITGRATASDPAPFVSMPLVFERAFGGRPPEGGEPFPANPVGRGFIRELSPAADGTPLPNVEDPSQPVREWDDHPPPAGWGVFGRAWRPRAGLAGRSEERDPVSGLAADFDPAFHNGAHPALHVPGYLTGSEPVELVGVAADGPLRFELPGRSVRVALRTRAGAGESPPRPVAAVLDTLVLAPDDGLFTLVWRASQPLSMEPERALELVAAVEIADMGAG